MKKLLGKIKLFSGFSARRKRFKLDRNHKAGLIFAGALLATSLVGCSIQGDKTADVPQQPEEGIVLVQEDEENGLSFLSDFLNVANLEMNSTLDTQSIADQFLDTYGVEYVGIGGEVDENGNAITDVTYEGNFFPGSDGNLWESEQDYLNYINGQNGNGTGSEVVEYIDDISGKYEDKNGDLWESEQDYLDFINGQNNNTNIDTPTEDEIGSGENNNDTDTSYKAQNETYWDSEEDYLASIGEGTTGMSDEYYYAKDGSPWESEQAYKDYIAGLESLTLGEDEYIIVEPGEGYQADDGSYWNSQEEYEEYEEFINSQNNNHETQEEVKEEVTETDEGYYVDKDGMTWKSEQDYNVYISSLGSEVVKEEVQPEVKDEVQVEVKEEVQPEVKDEVQAEVKEEVQPEVKDEVQAEVKEEVSEATNDHYISPIDGSVWVSEADHDAFMSAENILEKAL